MKTEKKYQDEFHLLISNLMTDTERGITDFKSVLGTVSTLIDDKRIEELSMVLRLHFPEYYSDYKPFKV